MDWEEAFEPQILDRGHDYQRRGLVQDLQVVGETLTATVLGSQAYRLTITLDAGEMTAAACDCPYALEHATCKHMAAVLFAWDQQDGHIDQTPDLTALVNQASPEQLRQFVTTALTREPSLIKTFKQIVIPEVVSSDLKGYQAMVDTIFDRYADEDGFIDYEAATGFADDLLIFLEDNLQDLIDAGKVDTVLQVLMNLFTALDQLDIDDSDGELIALLDQCTDNWEQIMEQATLPQKTRAFTWLQDQLSRPLDAVSDSLEDLLFNDFTEPAFLTAKLTLTAQRFQTAKRQRNDWEMDHWAGRHLRVMDQAGVAPEKIKAFCQANLSLNQVRQFYVTFCIQHQDYPTAIQLLKTGKHYQHLVTLLREMASYPMGQLMAEDLVSQWRQQYPRRRAMLDELSRF